MFLEDLSQKENEIDQLNHRIQSKNRMLEDQE